MLAVVILVIVLVVVVILVDLGLNVNLGLAVAFWQLNGNVNGIRSGLLIAMYMSLLCGRGDRRQRCLHGSAGILAVVERVRLDVDLVGRLAPAVAVTVAAVARTAA